MSMQIGHSPTRLAAGHNKSAQLPNSTHVDSHAVTKRLQSELMSLMASADPGVSAFPDGDSLFAWLGTIHGAKGTVYEGLSYKLSLKFPTGEPLVLIAHEGNPIFSSAVTKLLGMPEVQHTMRPGPDMYSAAQLSLSPNCPEGMPCLKCVSVPDLSRSAHDPVSVWHVQTTHSRRRW